MLVPMRRAVLAACIALLGCGSPPPAPDAGPPVDAGRDAPSTPDTGFDAGPPPAAMTAATPLAQWVDPFIGTGGIGYNDIGSTHPGPQWPFGMIRPGPDTANELGEASGYLHCSGYRALDEYITAFSQTRMHGVGINDYGAVALMPTIGATAERTMPNGLLSHFDDATERAAPGRYEVTLDSPSFAGGTIGVEITASPRVGFHRITFPSTGEAAIFVDLAHAHPGVEVREAGATLLPATNEIEGHVLFAGGYSDRFGGVDVHFVMRFDQRFVTDGTFEPGTLHADQTTRALPTGGVYVTFAPGSVVRVLVAISFVDVAHARLNLDAEDHGLDFDAARADAVAEWERRLSVLELEGRSETDFRLTYTGLYHSLLMPTLATDVDGTYRGVDQEIHTVDGFTYYTDFSLWDTYRTLHSLITMIEPDTANDFVRSLVAMAEVYGSYPRWPLGTGETGGMLGDPAAIVVADSWARGVRDYDLAHAYDLFLPSADGVVTTRGGIASYLALGWVSAEDGGSSASRTMEYAYADGALALMARELGRTEDAARFEARAQNYLHLFDPAAGYFVARRADGTFMTVDPDEWDEGYAEGNARQYLWLAPQDLDGLASVFGGTEGALARLTAFFEASALERRSLLAPIHYWQGNEPDIHAPFLFSAWGDPDGSARWSRWVLRAFYREGPAGLPGNDDGGTMSAWLVFTELGLYPLAGTDTLLVSSPLFTRSTLHLPGGDLVIEAPDAWEHTPYVHGLTRDGVEIPRDRMTHASIASGTTLHFDLGPLPAE
jgi:predicted alpha-1,2-mannosidase